MSVSSDLVDVLEELQMSCVDLIFPSKNSVFLFNLLRETVRDGNNPVAVKHQTSKDMRLSEKTKTAEDNMIKEEHQ